jgi:hypothetical protein
MRGPSCGLWKAKTEVIFALFLEKPLLNKKPFLSLVAALLAVSSAPAFVRQVYSGFAVAWNKNRTVHVHLSIDYPFGPFLDGFATLNDSAEDALNIWNQHLVHMRFQPVNGSPLPASDGDGNTSVTMSNSIYGESFGSDVLAVTVVSPRDDILAEADVIFNSAYSWNSYRGALKRDEEIVDFHRVALHEFGHVLGLGHPDEANPQQSVGAIMNSHISSLDSLLSDDINGAHSIYDNGPALLNSNPGPNLVNLSTRAFVGTGNDVVIAGFIIQGSQPATVVLRGIGGSLPGLGISNALEDPVIELHRSGGDTIVESDDWIGESSAGPIASLHLDPSNSREAGLIRTLNPGSYTVVLRSFPVSNGHLTGIALVELYDVSTTGARAGNISTRGPVFSGDQVLIAGFIVGGNQTKEVVVRAIGPSLSGAGVSGALQDPTLELRDASGNLVDSNDNWASHSKSAQIQSENLAPAQPTESALQATLAPGSYTAIVRGANNTSGVGLVEVYDLSPAP